jgi:serine-type D-Ala-D-Ala carboxypeptidase (penicillin-binding protein 5/6)
VSSGTRARLTAVALALFATLCGSAAASPPKLSSDSAIVVDARTDGPLLQQRADRRRPIASTTKLMTALVVLENTRDSQVFTAPAYHAMPGESEIGLREGERMTVHDLLRALLLPSANDAAETLAVGVAGSVPAFVRKMNARARQLGLSETHYSTPVGLDDRRNYSSARDLAKLATIDMRNPRFSSVVDLPRASLRSGAHPRTVQNRNLLVGRYPFVNGVKTGHTRDAGYVLVGSASGRGAHVISVVLGEPSEDARDTDSIALLHYGLDRFRRVPVLVAGRPLRRAKVRWRGDERATLTADRTVALTVRRGTQLQVRVKAPRRLKGPLPAHRAVGTAEVIADGKVVRTAPVVTARPVPGAGFIRKLTSALGGALVTIAVLLLLIGCTLVALRARAVHRQRTRSGR